ncbi:MAG: exodeoxyribonuclease VII small subunit [Deltaproteobacteria bacterium]|nr:MAG: exodeoxyribonuclease VII small subunit [Deltaproteobacteria bacterium]
MARSRRTSKARGPKDRKASEAEGTSTAEEGASAEAPEAIDVLLDRLEEVVEELENGSLPLEAALQRFEEGMTLVRQGRAALDALEQRIELLLEDGSREPFDPDADEDDTEEDP